MAFGQEPTIGGARPWEAIGSESDLIGQQSDMLALAQSGINVDAIMGILGQRLKATMIQNGAAKNGESTMPKLEA